MIKYKFIFLLYILIWYLELAQYLCEFFFYTNSSSSCSHCRNNMSSSPQWRSIVKIKHLSTLKLEKLNYVTWKAHTITHLQGYKLLPFIEKLVDSKDLLAIQQDQLLLALLFLAICTSILLQVIGKMATYDVWVTFQEIFNTKSRARVLQLRNQLQNC